MRSQSVMPKGDNQPVELPWLVEIANSLPPQVDAPDWGVRWHSPKTETYPLVLMAKQSLARYGFDVEKIEAGKFERFLDEIFPRERFAAFRDLIDGPDLGEMVVREEGVETKSAHRSRLANYRFVVTARRALREGAKLDSQIVDRCRPRIRGFYPLRICASCGLLFILRRANQKVCDKKCGATLRQRRKRDKDRQREYEVRRQLKMARNEQLKVKGARR